MWHCLRGVGVYRDSVPQTGSATYLTDSGIETDLISRGCELPEFAAFVLLDSEAGRNALREYYAEHVAIAAAVGCGLILEAATWRASPDWGARLGYSSPQLRHANQRAIELLVDVRKEAAGAMQAPLVVSGCIGPRSEDYEAEHAMTADEAAAYHREQIDTFAGTEADMVHAMTIAHTDEAIGIVEAAAAVRLAVAVSFTTEADGRLPDGSRLVDAITAVDQATDNAPAYYGINCSHPKHFTSALVDDPATARLRSIRANASPNGDGEPESMELDSADPVELAGLYRQLRAAHPQLTILGGCCGTDARHIAAIAAACVTNASGPSKGALHGGNLG
jgi:homocysteine S-methyltransferase